MTDARSLLALALALAATPALALAATPALAQETRPCAGAQNEAAMAACLHARDAADLDRIDKLGVEIKQHNDEGNFAEIFDAAHRAWLTFRAAECKSRTAESLNGSGYESILASCLVDLNRTRIEELQNRADSPER